MRSSVYKLLYDPDGDVYKDTDKFCDLYDKSNYPKEHFLHSTANNKVLGKMKNECAGHAIVRYEGLGSEVYSILDVFKSI